jgi:hypothetical protein
MVFSYITIGALHVFLASNLEILGLNSQEQKMIMQNSK